MGIKRVFQRIFRKQVKPAGIGQKDFKRQHERIIEEIEGVHGIGEQGKRILINSVGEDNLVQIVSHLQRKDISVADSVDLLLEVTNKFYGNTKSIINQKGLEWFERKLLELKEKGKEFDWNSFSAN